MTEKKKDDEEIEIDPNSFLGKLNMKVAMANAGLMAESADVEDTIKHDTLFKIRIAVIILIGGLMFLLGYWKGYNYASDAVLAGVKCLCNSTPIIDNISAPWLFG